MKNSKKMFKVLIMLLIICMVSVFAKPVFADDEDIFTNIAPVANTTQENTAQENTTPANTTTENATPANTTQENTTPANNTNNSIAYNNITTNNTVDNKVSTNRSVSNTNTLAKTGLTDSKGFVTLAVLICGISAIYSFKKISDYKRL